MHSARAIIAFMGDNTDWYAFFTGRANPGGRARVPVLNYLRNPEANSEVQREVRRAGEAADAATARAGPIEAPRWAQRATERTARDRRNAPPPASPPESFPIGPGGITDEPPPAPEADVERVPFRVASGQDTEPFGEDFARWYESVHGRPLPASLTAYRQEPAEGPKRFDWGLNTATGEGEFDNPARPLPNGPRGREPDSAPEATTWSDPSQELSDSIAAERRAFERQRQGRPTAYDMMFLAVFGARDRRAQVADENREMRRRIRDGEF